MTASSSYEKMQSGTAMPALRVLYLYEKTRKQVLRSAPPQLASTDGLRVAAIKMFRRKTSSCTAVWTVS